MAASDERCGVRSRDPAARRTLGPGAAAHDAAVKHGCREAPRRPAKTPARDSNDRNAAAPSASRPAWRAMRPDVFFAAAAIAALIVFALTYCLLVATETGQRLENLAVRGAEFRSTAARDLALARLGQISAVMFAVATVGVFIVGVARRRGGLGVVAAGIMVAGVVSAELLKELLLRPELITGPPWILRNSFPSGTAAVAAAVAIGAILVAPERIRWVIVPIAALCAAVVGEALQATGWHRLSDIVGSTVLVIGVACGGLGLLARVGLVEPSAHGRLDRRIRGGLLVVAGVLVALGGLLLLLLALFPILTAPEGGAQAFLQAAFPLAGAGLTILSFVLFARLLEPFSLGHRSPNRAVAVGRDDLVCRP